MKAEHKRERIVEVAMQLMIERGYAETSIADVAAQAGLLKGNLAYYFKTKAELLAAVSQALELRYMATFTGALPPDADGMTCLLAFLGGIEGQAAELARSGCPVGTLCSQLGKQDAALQAYPSHILKAVQAWLGAQFARLLPADAPHAAYAEQLLAQMQGAALLAHAFRDTAVVLRQVETARRWLDQLNVLTARG